MGAFFALEAALRAPGGPSSLAATADDGGTTRRIVITTGPYRRVCHPGYSARTKRLVRFVW